MEPTSIPGLAFSMGSSSGSVLSSSLAVCSPEALPTDPTTIVPMTTSNDVETTGHQAQQLASVFGSVTMSTAQKSPSLPQPNQHSEHDNLALLRSLGPLDETQSRARLEDRISGAGSLPILLQSAGSNAGTSVKEVACNPTFRAIPCIDPMTSPAFPRSQLADNQNLIYTGLPVEHHHAQNPHTSSLETAANLLHGSTTHGNDLFADRRLDLSIQPPSGGRFAYSSAHEGTPFQPSIDQQIIQSTMTPRDPTLFHSQNVHLLDRQQAMSQLSIAHVLANAPLSGNSVMAGKQIYSPAGPGDMSIQPSARSHGSTHNQGGRLSIDQRIASQSPAVIQDNDPPSDDLNRGRISSPVGRQLGAVMPQGSTPAYDQATQVLMDKQTMNPRYSPWQPVDEYYGTRFELSNHQESRLSPGLQYSSLPRFGQTSLLGNAHGHYYEQRAANQQLVADRALSGLPAPESFDIASHQNNRSQDQHALGVRPFRGDHGSSNLQGHFSWDQSYERQRPEYYHPTTSWHIPNDMTYQPVARRPIFGFSSLDEAQAFEPLPRKRELQFSNTHRALAEEQHRQSNVQNIADPNHQSGKVSFAFPAGRDTAKAPHPFERPVSDFPTIRSSTQAHTVKQEHVSPKPLDDLRKSDDEQFVANTTPEFWDQFALSKFSASKDLDNLHHADNGKGSNNPRFGQVSLDDPRAKLEPGEILEYGSVKSPEASLTSVYYHPGASGTPTWLRDITVSYLTDNEVLFFFNVIAIMGQMKPQFKFKHGNSGGEKVIARLTLWGYLVVAEPTSDSVRAAEVIACRQALEKMQEQNSKWVVPPLPTDGPTGPGWIWTKLLKDFCTEQRLTRPRYKPIKDLDGWYCNISMDTKPYQGERKCITLGGAENTTAHMTLYQLSIMGIDDPARKPVVFSNSASRNASVPVWGSLGKFMENPFHTIGGSNNGHPGAKFSKYGHPTDPPSKKSLGGKRASKKGANVQLQKHPERTFQFAGVSKPAIQPRKRSAGFYHSRSRWAKQRKIEALEQHLQRQENQIMVPQNHLSPPPGFAHAANRIPLGSCRLSPVECPEDPIDDSLVKLRSLDAKLGLLSQRSSFRRILETICEVIHIDYPDIVHGGSSSNSRVKFAYPHEMFANFTGDPYLSRASPIKLVDVNSSDPEVAQEIGVKSTILYLLGIIRDDARLDQQMYGDEAPNVKRIHDETVKSLSAQNKPISALPN